MQLSTIRAIFGGVLALTCVSANPQPSSYEPAQANSEIMENAVVMKSLFTDIVRTKTGALAVGERGNVMISTDLKAWKQISVPTRSLLTNAFVLGDQVWAVGHEEVILHSGDSGATWERQHDDPAAFGPILDVYFLDANNGLAVGVEGLLLRTNDAGKTWVRGNITDGIKPVVAAAAVSKEEEFLPSDEMGQDETPPHLNCIVKSGAVLLVLGESGAVFSSVDSGLTWKRGSLPYKGSIFGAITLSDNSILAYGLNGNAFATADAGATWVKLESDTDASLMGAVAAENGRAVLVGARGNFLTKSPESNKLGRFVDANAGALAGVIQSGATDFIVVGENGIAVFDPTKFAQ
jgi:photosystem II stability/assembly factor-like uncharacterized protein